MCLVLPWFVVCFWTLWCDTGGCEQQGEYKRVSAASCTWAAQALGLETNRGGCCNSSSGPPKHVGVTYAVLHALSGIFATGKNNVIAVHTVFGLR
jgi:hypothetical protein